MAEALRTTPSAKRQVQGLNAPAILDQHRIHVDSYATGALSHTTVPDGARVAMEKGDDVVETASGAAGTSTAAADDDVDHVYDAEAVSRKAFACRAYRALGPRGCIVLGGARSCPQLPLIGAL